MRMCDWHGGPSAEAMLGRLISGREEVVIAADKSGGDFVQFAREEGGYLRCEVSLESYPGAEGKIGSVLRFAFLKPEECLEVLDRFASGGDMASVIDGWEDVEQRPGVEAWLKWLIGAVVIVVIVFIYRSQY